MEEACAEGIGAEHYRLEGRSRLLLACVAYVASLIMTGMKLPTLPCCDLIRLLLPTSPGTFVQTLICFHFVRVSFYYLHTSPPPLELLPPPSISPRCCAPCFHSSTTSLSAKCMAESRQQVDHLSFLPVFQTHQKLLCLINK